MSSPLSSLKKGTRNPNLPGRIPGHRPIPFRHPEYSEDESKLLEEITTKMATTRHKACDPFSTDVSMDSSPNPSMRGGGNNNGNADNSADPDDSGLPPPSDRELMKLMMARLAIMEQKIQTQQHEISSKDRRIHVLEDKLRIYTKARGGDTNNSNGEATGTKDKNASSGSSESVRDLEQHCLLMQQQVHEMETFLADYGMVWVGDQDDPEGDIYLDDPAPDEVRKSRQAEAGLVLEDVMETRGEPHFRVNFPLLFDNIRDLNIIAGEGQQVVQYTADGARLGYVEAIPVAFYANGMIMFEGPFRSYSDPATVQCVQDFLDGYYPTELQNRYPDGVPFAVKDMSTVMFKPGKALDVFSGTGQILGGDEVASRLVGTTKMIREREEARALEEEEEKDKTKHATTASGSEATSVISSTPFKPVGAATFLNRLPQSVVKGGKVIDIRSSVGKVIAGTDQRVDKTQVSLVETQVTKAIQKTVTEAKVDRPKTPRDITTLRIKSESGAHTYIVKMRCKETIGDLRKYLNAHRAANKGAAKDYDILCAYPKKLFSDNAATMDACGLVPNGVLCLQAKKKA